LKGEKTYLKKQKQNQQYQAHCQQGYYIFMQPDFQNKPIL